MPESQDRQQERAGMQRLIDAMEVHSEKLAALTPMPSESKRKAVK